jgi:hypothetical protein
MSNTKKATRKGAGRTKGSFSFVTATTSQMLAANPNPDFRWLLSRKQAEALGMTGLTTDKIGDLKESLAGTSEETAPKVKAEEF